MARKLLGFTLIELLVYVLLVGFAAFVMISSNIVFGEWVAQATSRQQHQLALMLAGDVIMRDVTAASALPQYWHKEQRVFRRQWLTTAGTAEEEDVAYAVDDGALLRVHGVFDYQRGRWREQQSTPIVQATMREVRLAPEDVAALGRVCRVSVSVQTIDGKMTTLVYRLRSREVLYAR